jgi:hypothetical protein
VTKLALSAFSATWRSRPRNPPAYSVLGHCSASDSPIRAIARAICDPLNDTGCSQCVAIGPLAASVRAKISRPSGQYSHSSVRARSRTCSVPASACACRARARVSVEDIPASRMK